MKRYLFYFVVSIMFLSCNDDVTDSDETIDTSNFYLGNVYLTT